SLFSLAPTLLELYLLGHPQITDPAAFIKTLCSHHVPNVLLRMRDNWLLHDSFFCLPRSFWEKFLNEKLSNKDFEWVEEGHTIGSRITKEPVNLPDSTIDWLHWEIVNSKLP
ncbi:hypothetical protein PMAYCL1PPCAC_27170, partial [Pristionchus mayeri]